MPIFRARCALQRQRQRGAGAVGFLLAGVPVILLGLGGIELAHWYSLQQVLSMALTEAARAGSVRQGQPQAIAAAFEQGLHMMWPQQRTVDRILQDHRSQLGLPWHIRILLPLPSAFADHADPGLDFTLPSPRPWIRNNYQPVQHARNLAHGWPGGRGPRSGLTIFDANTLSLELFWPQRPMLPGVGAIVRALAPLAAEPLDARWMAAGYLPFRRYASVAMQSHPANWPALADGRIIYVGNQQSVPGGGPPSAPDAAAQTPAGGAPGQAGTPDQTSRPDDPWPAQDLSSPMPGGPYPGKSGSDGAGSTAPEVAANDPPETACEAPP